jgi:ABC-type transport system substrate-binding protein
MAKDIKNIAIIVLSICLVVSGISNIFLASGPEAFPSYPLASRILVVGTLEGPSDLDPIHSWDSESNNVIEQVCEGLYQYNLSDPDLGIIPMLAADYGMWNPTATQLTIPLRHGVLFHDGTKFNASSVRWTFERINYFINASGMPWILNDTRSKIHSLYEFPNGTTILDPVNPVTINSEYSVTINLRGSYAILESLLCYVTAYMLSPASTPQFELVDTAYGRIIGTGPFRYLYCIRDTEVRFERFDDYWGGSAFFEEVYFSIINDATTRSNAMLDHTIDYLIGAMSSLFSSFNADPKITYKSGTGSLSYYYLGMNNENINKTWRQAISWAIDYSYITEELQDGTVYRSNGPLAPEFPGYDPTIQAATYNLTKAREIVVSMGFGDMGWSDAQWQVAEFAAWNYTYPIGNDFKEDLLILLQDNLDLIGIEVIDANMRFEPPYWTMPWDKYIEWLRQGLFWLGWYPDYLSPFNMIAPLFSNISTYDAGPYLSNAVHYHNHDVEAWLEQVLKEPNLAARQALFSNILHQIVEVDMPHAFGYHPYQHYVHSADIHGVPYNAMGILYIYPMYRA